jgi:hypothetical protein
MKQFWFKFAAAFAATGWLYTFLHLAVSGSFSFQQSPTISGGVQAFLTQTLFSLIPALGVVAGFLLLVAYPLERHWDKKQRGLAYRMVLYVVSLVVFGIAVFVLWGILTRLNLWPDLVGYPNSVWFSVIAIGSVVAAVISLIARPLYPQLLKRPVLSIGLVAGLLALCVIGAVNRPTLLNMQSNTAPVGGSFYPERAAGELARGTWTHNPNNGSYGTEFYISGKPMEVNGQYEITFACKPGKNPIKFEAVVENLETFKQVYKIDITCADSKVQYFSLKPRQKAFIPRLMLSHVEGTNAYHEAWAVLAPGND